MPLYAMAEPPSACRACAPCHPDICTAQVHAVISEEQGMLLAAKAKCYCGNGPIFSRQLHHAIRNANLSPHGVADKFKAYAWPH